MPTLSSLYVPDGNELVLARINQLLQQIRSLQMSTQVELQAEIYSQLNAILALGNNVSNLYPVRSGTPAVADDVYGNLALISQDALGISQRLLALEQDGARLFNLAAAAQNTLRQQVREKVYTSTYQKYQETFINNQSLDAPNTSASLDFSVGAAALPVLSEQIITPSISLGVNCDGGTLTGDLSNLLDADPTSTVTWNGSLLELVFTFPQPVILNRIKLTLNSYQGLYLNMLLSSPDGILVDDIRQELPFEQLSLDGSANKFSGDVTLDFDPRHVKQLRLVLQDQTADNQISLRDITFSARTFDATAYVQTKPILFDALGVVDFTASSHSASDLTSITHQLSYDGVTFQVVTPGRAIDLGATKCWYRAILQRLDSNFTQKAAPVADPGTDPATTGWYQMQSTSTLDLGNNVLQRTLQLSILTPPIGNTTPQDILLQDTLLPNTISVFQNNILLGPDVYQISGNTLHFATDGEMPGIVITYQTSAVGNAGLVARKSYYSPRLYGVTFERAF